MDKNTGYEYEVVATCPRTGRPVVSPKAWSYRKVDGMISPRPRYATCHCCKKRQ